MAMITMALITIGTEIEVVDQFAELIQEGFNANQAYYWIARWFDIPEKDVREYISGPSKAIEVEFELYD
jgi:hypothetical protein